MAVEISNPTKTAMIRQDLEHQRRTRHWLDVIPHTQEVSDNIFATCLYYEINRYLSPRMGARSRGQKTLPDERRVEVHVHNFWIKIAVQ